MKKDFGSVINYAKAQLSGKPPYFYDPLVPAGPPEDLVHALGAQRGAQHSRDGFGGADVGLDGVDPADARLAVLFL